MTSRGHLGSPVTRRRSVCRPVLVSVLCPGGTPVEAPAVHSPPSVPSRSRQKRAPRGPTGDVEWVRLPVEGRSGDRTLREDRRSGWSEDGNSKPRPYTSRFRFPDFLHSLPSRKRGQRTGLGSCQWSPVPDVHVGCPREGMRGRTPSPGPELQSDLPVGPFLSGVRTPDPCWSGRLLVDDSGHPSVPWGCQTVCEVPPEGSRSVRSPGTDVGPRVTVV